MKSNSPFYQDKCQVAWEKWEADRMKSKSLTKDTRPGTEAAARELKEKAAEILHLHVSSPSNLH